MIAAQSDRLGAKRRLQRGISNMTETHGCHSVPLNISSDRCAHTSSVERRLRSSGYLALRRIHCACEGGVLSLHGCVPSHYLKQVAQAIADEVEGVDRVDNQIRVQSIGVAGRPSVSPNDPSPN
jgi:osmotically-inducible protein OsmY